MFNCISLETNKNPVSSVTSLSSRSKMDGASNNRTGLQVVKISAEPGRRCELDEEALGSILLREDIRNLPVVVVSVAGAFRGGKSFILDFFLRYLKASREDQLSGDWLGRDDERLEGFDWRGGGQSNTKGIHLWPEPIISTIARTGEKVAVLLMDTQGTFDMESDMGDNSAIFALSTLLSSVQIYNLQGNMGEDDLQHLQLFTEYGRLVRRVKGKAFQTLLFLIRDWNSPYEHDYGYVGGEEFMNIRFELRINQREQVQNVRKHVRSCFESLQCFLMPHPGLSVTNETFRGCLSDIEKNFKVSLLELVPSLFDPNNLTPKIVNNYKVQASALFEFFKKYVDIFNSEELPEVISIYQATADACVIASIQEAREHYSRMMESNIKPDQSVTQSIMEEWHNAAVAGAVAVFENKKKIGSQSYVSTRLADLKKELQIQLDSYLQENRSKLNVAESNAMKAFNDEVNAVCEEQVNICLHVKDLRDLYDSAAKTALAVFDSTRTLVPREEDMDREDFIKVLQDSYKSLRNYNDQTNRRHALEAREMYLSRMRYAALKQGVTADDLKKQHLKVLDEAIDHFKSLRNRPTNQEEEPNLVPLLRVAAEHCDELCALNEFYRKKTKESRDLHDFEMRKLKERISDLENKTRRDEGGSCTIL